MKSTSKKSTGLLGGFDFQPIFSEQTLSRSEPKEEEVSQTKPNNAEQEPIKPSDVTDSHAQPSEAELSGIKPKQAKDSGRQPNNAVVSESKPKKLKQAKEVQRLIEQGDVPGALAEAGLTKKKIPMPESHQGVASGDGKRSKRITILMSEEERNEIARIVGLGALKYFILKVDARKNMLFNPEESIDFNGNTGPFIQYTYARIRSILRKAAAEGITIPTTLSDEMPLNEKEIELIQKLNEFGAAVEQAGKDYSPSGIANYCYELTKAFNQFYHDYSILGADTENEKVVRLVLAQNVGKTLKNGMALLGIEVPERM